MSKVSPLVWVGGAVAAYLIFGGNSSAAPAAGDSSGPPAGGYAERGYRNNNPGNIAKSSIPWDGKVSPGTDSTYEQFSSMAYGLRALYKNLISYLHTGTNTISSIIRKWSGGNNTDAYIRSVSADTGLSPSAVITADNLIPLAKAIVKFENGIQRLSDGDYQKAYGMI